MTLAVDIWNLLGRVQSLLLTAATKDRSSFFNNAAAAGSVGVSMTGSRVITFHEAGLWTSSDHQTIDFRNIYQWSLSDLEDTIRLTHLRYGADNPVHLVDFRSIGTNTMSSFQPHVCGADRYSASLSVAGDRILLNWRILGPAKNDSLDCTYSTDKTHQEDRNDN
ncbi:MAG: DUF6314 family protein [Desulfobacterales bacterium]|nr:DUF6314 family protein [Desulfobacterales bacterium]